MSAHDDTSPAAGSRLSTAAAAALAAEHFDLVGEVRELGSNEDQNFVLEREAGGPIVLKLTRTTPRDELVLQNAVLEQVGAAMRAAGLRSPRVHRRVDGESVVDLGADSGLVHFRALDFLTGRCASARPGMAPSTAAGIGRAAGVIVRALADLPVPPDTVNERWDLRRGAAVVRMLLPAVPAEGRGALQSVVESVEAWVAPRAAALPVQLIHGDVTADNVVVDDDGTVTGVIDFGDLAPGWRVAEVAIAATSMLRYGEEGPRRALEVIRAFDEVSPLSDDEIAVVWPLITMRAAVLAASGAEIAAADPRNAYARVRRPFEDVVLGGALAWGFDEARLRVAEALGRIDDVVVTGALVDAAIDPARASVYGEYRASADAEPGWRGARPLALAVDVTLDAGAVLRAPEAGAVTAASADAVAVRLAGGAVLHLSGVAPLVGAGTEVSAGDPLARPAASVRVQLCAVPAAVPPPFVHVGAEAAWRRICPDPSSLLGLASPPARALDEPGVAHPLRPVPDRPHVVVDALGRVFVDAVRGAPVLPPASGGYLAERLDVLRAAHRGIGRLDIDGVEVRVAIVADDGTGRADAEAARAICEALLAEGVLARRSDARPDALQIAPSLTTDAAAVDVFVAALDRVMGLRAAWASLA